MKTNIDGEHTEQFLDKKLQKTPLQRTYKFRLYPNSKQTKKLHHTIGAARWVYNRMVEKIRKEGFQT